MQIKDLPPESRDKLIAIEFELEDDLEKEGIVSGYIYSYFFTPLMYAVFAGDLELVKDLVEHSVNFQTSGKGSLTPLMLAAKNGKHTIVEYLLDKGADAKRQVEYEGRQRDAYSISKQMRKQPLCSVIGFWQKTQKILGTADITKTCEILHAVSK